MPSDKEIQRAIRRRIIDEINSRAVANHSSTINNNNYSGGSSPKSDSGEAKTLSERMLSGDDDPFDYKVMIARKDSPNINKSTKKPDGWAKKVHRYRTKKDEDDPYDDLFDHLKKKAGIPK